MKLMAVALAGGVLLAGDASAEVPPIVSACAHSPQTPEDKKLRYFPERAARDHVSGDVKLQCAVQRGGSLTDCTVLEERPAGYDFGSTALKMVHLFCASGQPGATIAVPFRFKMPWETTPPPSLAGSAVAPTPSSSVAQMAPTAETLAKYYPEAAMKERVKGRVRAKCTVGAGGTLTDCSVVSEDPAGYGFGDSALKILATYRVDPNKNAPGSKVLAPVTFDPPPPIDTAWAAEGRYFPDRAQKEGREGAVSLRCMVTAEGLLKHCRVEKEDPKDYDFGKAALKMAEVLHVDTQNPKYAPGSTVSIPVKFTTDALADQKPAQ